MTDPDLTGARVKPWLLIAHDLDGKAADSPRAAVRATLPAWDGTPLAAAGCPECGRTVRVKADGVSLYRHGPNKAPCPMSHQEVRVTDA